MPGSRLGLSEKGPNRIGSPNASFVMPRVLMGAIAAHRRVTRFCRAPADIPSQIAAVGLELKEETISTVF